MAQIKDLKSELRETGYRGAVRVNSRVKIAVEWHEGGQALRAEGYTRDISPKGCLAVVPKGFSVGDRLRLVNLANENCCDALLVWRGHESHAGWELGLELQNAVHDFWGMEF
jgi:PilZ domain